MKADTVGSRMPVEKVVQVLKLHDAGEGPTAIARAVQSDIRTIGGVIRRYRDRVSAAKALMAQSTLDMVHHWQQAVPIASARGDHRPAKEYLQAVGVVEMGQSRAGGDTKVAVQVIVGTPTHPIDHDPLNPKPIK